MPAEAIHLSALRDTRAGADGAIARLLSLHEAEARLGAVLVDLPYFERFPVELLRYVARRPPRPSPWGDRFHRLRPAQVGLELVRAARASRSSGLFALTLGYLSHLAVDWAIHPLVNRLARARAVERGTTEAAEHREVEKFHSVLFHEQRFGADLMGTRALVGHIDIDGARLADHAAAIEGAVRRALGEGPPPGSFAAWARGYRQYVAVLGSPLGKLPATPAAKARERPALYDQPNFPAEYARAVERSARYVAAGYAALEADRLDEHAFFARIPEGSIDDPPLLDGADVNPLPTALAPCSTEWSS